MNKYSSIYDFIVSEEAAFTQSIDINGWSWNFKQHVKQSFYYLHGRLLEGNDPNIPVKNITRRIQKLKKSEQDVDVKDITLYVDEPGSHHLSFLIKKYHDDIYVQENDLDTFIDEWLESRLDYGGGLCKKGKQVAPEVIDLQSIAFCDQTDLLKGPIAFKHFYNPAELKDMEAVGWGSESSGANGSIDDLIELSSQSKQQDKQQGIENKTPGNYIEIYEIHGVLPEHFLTDGEDTGRFKRQFQIVGMYRNKEGDKQGITLFRKEQKKSLLDTTISDKVFSRALGYGGVEELFEDQVWTNWNEIVIKDMLEAASKIILQTTDPQVAQRNSVKNMENLSILQVQDGASIGQVDTFPRSMNLMERWNASWEEHAQGTAFANNPLLGEEAKSGVPFRAQERQVIQGKGPHNRERGKFAKDLERVYRQWIIPDIIESITNGVKFLSELSTEEMRYVSDCLVRSEADKFAIEQIFNGNTNGLDIQIEAYKEKVREEFARGGNKRFLEILKGEFKNKSIRVKINIAGKQKDISQMADSLTNILRQIMANPQGFQQMMQIPEIAETFNNVLEYSGISPILYTGKSYGQQGLPQGQPQAPQAPQAPQLQAPQPSLV